MKRALPIILFSLTCVLANAQTILFSDNFDNYKADTLLEPQSPNWTGWFGIQTQSLVSTDTSSSGKNSALIWAGAYAGGASPSDAVGLFGSINTGKVELKFKQFIPSKIGTREGGGYFNLQHNYTNSAGSWAIEVYALKAGTGMKGQVNTEGRQVFYNLQHDKWAEYRFVIDFSLDSAWMWYDSTFVYNWKWTSTSNSATITGPNQLNAIDLYASCIATDSVNCEPRTYYDDFIITRLPQPPALMEFSNVNPADQARINVQGLPTNTLQFDWEETISIKGDPIVYNLLIDSVDGDFAMPLVNLRANRQGRDTFLTFSYGQLANILSNQLNIAPGDSMELSWTAQAYTAFDTLLASPSRRIKLIRGSITGINLLDLRNISIYPNPSKGQVNFDFSKEKGSFDLEIYTSQGRLLQVENELSGQSFLDLSIHPPGHYLIRISGEKGICYKPLILE